MMSPFSKYWDVWGLYEFDTEISEHTYCICHSICIKIAAIVVVSWTVAPICSIRFSTLSEFRHQWLCYRWIRKCRYSKINVHCQSMQWMHQHWMSSGLTISPNTDTLHISKLFGEILSWYWINTNHLKH